jgi:hypothetical protein
MCAGVLLALERYKIHIPLLVENAMDQESEDATWLGVIGRSLAYLALHRAELGNSDKGEQALFLEGLGLPREDVAAMLNTSADSIAVLIGRMKRGKSRGKK